MRCSDSPDSPTPRKRAASAGIVLNLVTLGVGLLVALLTLPRLLSDGAPRWLHWSPLLVPLGQALVISFVLQSGFMLGQVIWTSMLQQLVPRELLGRVSSLDWMMSVGLVPVSYALTGPVSGALGVDATLILAGVLGSILMSGLLFLPGVRDPERLDEPAVRSRLESAA